MVHDVLLSSVKSDKRRDVGSKTALAVPNRYMGMENRERLGWSMKSDYNWPGKNEAWKEADLEFVPVSANQ
jgi:hypothetical protein